MSTDRGRGATADDLAIFGASPLFAEPLHIGRPNIGDRDALAAHLADILDSRWLTNAGPKLREFERRFAQWSEVDHCVAMCNATVALEIAIRALDMTGEVIVPSATFVATAHALQWQQIRPVFADIDPDTHNLAPGAVESRITDDTTGIIGVHLWGRASAVEELEEIARARNLRLVFDAAHAVGCTYRGKRIGGFGHAEVVSFHATKVMNTFEGGAILTNDAQLAEKARLMRNFGFAGIDKVVHVGTNGKMNEIAAAMGLVSLDSFDGFVEANRENYEHYARRLRDVPGVSLLRYDAKEKNNYQYVVMEYERPPGGVSRDQFVDILWHENVRARRYFYPGCHMMEPYRTLYPEAGRHLHQTERVLARVVCLPTGTAVGPNDVDAICDVIECVVLHSSDIASRLEGS